MLEELPLKKISTEELKCLVHSEGSPLCLKRVMPYLDDFLVEYDRTKVYLIHAKPEDYLIRKNGRTFDRQDYYTNPIEWQSVFGDRVHHLSIEYVSSDTPFVDHALCDASHQWYRVVNWLPSPAFY